MVLAAALLAIVSCRDDEVADDPILPDNVSATLESCAPAEGSPTAAVTITNGTGHEATYEVTVHFRADGRVEGTGTGRSKAVRPGGTQTVQVRVDSDRVAAADECDLESVDEVDA